ncbi:hypothetical protein Ciccas_014257 [Cichlidogyrus casuarinus]|uniref:Uncharacterized protein n=1 Tax=Cichlidogyrus casuarinus TaxID=1844966 RepID=A0ABD2PIL0_9PLAT
MSIPDHDLVVVTFSRPAINTLASDNISKYHLPLSTNWDLANDLVASVTPLVDTDLDPDANADFVLTALRLAIDSASSPSKVATKIVRKQKELLSLSHRSNSCLH